jgi:hypothetical protein
VTAETSSVTQRSVARARSREPPPHIESRVDVNYMTKVETSSVLNATLALIAFFILVELIEVWEDGVGYFINMWNLMDWVCFVFFFLVYYWYQQLDVYLNDASCGDGAIVCEAIGFHDDWKVMGTTKTIKLARVRGQLRAAAPSAAADGGRIRAGAGAAGAATRAQAESVV